MASKNRTNSNGGGVFGAAAKVIALVLVLAIAAAFVWFAVATNGFKNFNRVQLGGGQVITEKTTGVQLLAGAKTEFSVKNLNFTTTAPDYTATITFNEEKAFDYSKDGELYTTRGDAGDLSAYFGFEKSESGFSLSVPETYSAAQALRHLYPAAEIELEAEPDPADLYLLTLSFTDGSEYHIFFGMAVLNVTLDPPRITI